MLWKKLWLAVWVLLAVQVVGAVTIEQALDGNRNGLLDDSEMLQALHLWIRQSPVAGTDGLTISDLKILELLQLWIKQTPLPGGPPPPPTGRACPDAPAGARTLTVPGEFPTIQQAIENARQGDKIVVKPGTYPGGIVISKSIIVESEGGPSVTQIASTSDQKGIVILRTSGAVVRGFGISGGRSGISIEASSQICIEQNEIFNNLGPGIEIAGTLTELGREAQDVTLVKNTIRNNAGYGIIATEFLRGTILDNQIRDTAAYPDGSAGYGIAVIGGSRVEIRKNAITRSRSHGLFTSGVTDLQIAENQISLSPTAPRAAPAAGIVIGRDTIGALLTRNTIGESEIGILIEEVRSLTSQENVISRSMIAGMRITRSLLVRLEGDRITETQPPARRPDQPAIGIEVLNDSTVSLTGVTVHRSFGYGLLVRGGAEVEVARSVIEQTSGRPGVPGRGVGVQGASLRMTDSTLVQNADDGVAVLADGRAELSRNTIRGHRNFGILADVAGTVSCPEANTLVENGQDRSENVPSACGG